MGSRARFPLKHYKRLAIQAELFKRISRSWLVWLTWNSCQHLRITTRYLSLFWSAACTNSSHRVLDCHCYSLHASCLDPPHHRLLLYRDAILIAWQCVAGSGAGSHGWDERHFAGNDARNGYRCQGMAQKGWSSWWPSKLATVIRVQPGWPKLLSTSI